MPKELSRAGKEEESSTEAISAIGLASADEESPDYSYPRGSLKPKRAAIQRALNHF